MKVTLDENILKYYNLTMGEFLYLLLGYTDANMLSIKESLLSKNLCNTELTDNHNIILDNNCIQLIENILINSTKIIQNSRIDYVDIAKAMQECYPKGKKAGTTYQWRDSVGIIAKKLKTVQAVYNFNFTKEQAIAATTAYVKSFNGEYKLMHLLKYFILKNDRNTGEAKSEFMSYVENLNQEDEYNNEWTATLK